MTCRRTAKRTDISVKVYVDEKKDELNNGRHVINDCNCETKLFLDSRNSEQNVCNREQNV